MKKFAYSLAIRADKVEDWLSFVDEVNNNRNKEFSEMHARIGVLKESWYLQQKEENFEVVVYTEAEDENFMMNFKNDDSEFSNWFRESVAACQPINLDSETTMPRLVLDWNE
ncbi:hypothetical protein [Zunongwangia sp.]|uniref:hypothetical protein n=1 Tax=Zunongwangia sp. TaxID=1965325 RepID=UPI003AA7C405